MSAIKIVKWSKDMALTLIAAVQKFEIIWKKRKFVQPTKVKVAWLTIAVDTFGGTIPYAKLRNKWNRLCVELEKYVDLHNETGEMTDDGWAYWSAFEFLRQSRVKVRCISLPTRIPS